MLQKRVVLIFTVALLLSACSGGVSGIMSSSSPGYWQIYKISYQPGMKSNLDKPIETLLEDLFFNLGFKQKGNWGSPLLSYARVASFEQKYSGRPIDIKVEIDQKTILIMSMSYSKYTKDVFNNLASALNQIFGADSIEACYGLKDVDGRTCLQY